VWRESRKACLHRGTGPVAVQARWSVDGACGHGRRATLKGAIREQDGLVALDLGLVRGMRRGRASRL
jgi:hypothetical protein